MHRLGGVVSNYSAEPLGAVANMFFEEQVSDHSGLLLSTMQMAAHGGGHLGLVGRSALAQGYAICAR